MHEDPQSSSELRRRLSTPVYDGDSFGVGTFRCPVDEPIFEDTGPIERFLVVFPRTSVWIQHRDGEAFVADPLVTTIYNRGQRYRRFPISADGDRSDWWALSNDLAREVAARVEPRSADTPEQPYRWERAPSNAALYRDQRSLFRRIRAGIVEPLEVEEGILSIVYRVLFSAARDRRGAECVRPRRRRARELADAARELLAKRLETAARLHDLATELDVSPFHLAHVFSAVTGTSLHAARLELRLRVALERITGRDTDLSGIAHDLGFSSHSHFTAAFHRRFGVAPSSWRRLGRLAPQGVALPGRRT